MADLIDSASILIIRDNDETGKLEVLLVKRHEDIAFAGGAYVFPGGKVDPEDQALVDTSGIFPHGYGELIGTAVREVYEESRMIVGHLEEISHDVEQLLDEDISIAEFMQRADIKYFKDEIIPFARWITPKIYSKRFDTRFFLAKAPVGQIARPDQKEVVEVVWTEPLDFIDKNRENMMFPTIMNLKLLAQANTVEDAMAHAKARKIITVEPKLVDGKRVIDPAAGYGEIDQDKIHPGMRNITD